MAREQKEDRSTTERDTNRTDVPVTPRRGTWRTPSRSAFASPFNLMRELSDEMSRMFNVGTPLDTGLRRFESDTWLPQVDVLRRGENLVVRADLPGLSKKDISIDVSDDRLTIRGERREEHEEEREGYFLHERSEGSFERTIPLPEGADAEKANARFENGVLEVTVPAPEREPTRTRRIEIR